ncbi:molybdopterin-dependent oxidoreductase [Caldicellulosiruptoraceae bacterium PP1]
MKITSCPLDCFDACSINAEIIDNKITKLYGNKEHPITDGFLCRKGYKLLKNVYSEERIKAPLIRHKNDFHQISWNEAIDLIAEQIESSIKRYTSSSLLYCSGDGYEGFLKNVEKLFFDYLGGATYSKGSLCWGAGLLAQNIDFGNSLSHNPFDLFNSKTVVLWGRNIKWTNLHLYYLIRKVKKLGIKVVTIDVYNSPSMDIADEKIIIKPASDSFFAYGIIKYLIENDLINYNFINNFSIGFDKIKETAKNISFDQITQNTGTTYHDIEKIALIYCNRPVATFIGYGPQRYLNGVNTIRTIDYVIAVSGNIGIKGGGANYANRYSKDIFSDIFEKPCLRINERFYVSGKLAHFLNEVENPPIEFIYISGSNPVSQSPDSDLLFNQLRKRFVVHVDIKLNATSMASTIILPACTFAEKQDIFITNMWHDYISISEKLIEPLFESKSEVDIINLLAKRLSVKEFPIRTQQEWINILKSRLNDKQVLELETKGFTRGTKIDIPWADYIFNTPSKKFEFNSEEYGYAIPKLDIIDNNKKSFRVITIHPKDRLHSQSFIEKNEIEILLNLNDAKKLKLDNNDHILLYNKNGSITGKVKICSHVPQGTVILEEGFQDLDINVLNSISDTITSEYDKQAAFNSNFVFIKKVEK